MSLYETTKHHLKALKATILDWIQREGGQNGNVISVDRHHPDMVPLVFGDLWETGKDARLFGADLKCDE